MIRKRKRLLPKPARKDQEERAMSTEDKPPKRRTGRPLNPRVVPDAAWLEAQMRLHKITQKELAARLDMNSEATFTKSKNGKRLFSLPEAVKLAEAFRLSLNTVVGKLGFTVREPSVPIMGRVTSDSRVSPVVGNRQGERVPATNAPPGAVAYIYEPDGTLFIVDRSDKSTLPSVLSRLYVVEADNQELPLLGKFVKSPQRNAIAFKPHYGDEIKLLKQLHGAWTVVEIINP